jgi:hypothetical protein
MEDFEVLNNTLEELSIVNCGIKNVVFPSTKDERIPYNDFNWSPFKFKQLKKLDLSHNAFGRFPEFLFSFVPNLEWLSITNSKITKFLPPSLPALTYLNLSYNNMTDLMWRIIEVEDMPKLEHLILAGNHLGRVPFIEFSSNLTSIDLSEQNAKFFLVEPLSFYRENFTRKLHINLAQNSNTKLVVLLNSFCSPIANQSHIASLRVSLGEKTMYRDMQCYFAQLNGVKIYEVNKPFMCSCYMVNFLAQNNVTMPDCEAKLGDCKAVRPGSNSTTTVGSSGERRRRHQQCDDIWTYDCSTVEETLF